MTSFLQLGFAEAISFFSSSQKHLHAFTVVIIVVIGLLIAGIGLASLFLIPN